VFDGHSLVIESDGSVLARAPGFEEALLVVDLDRPESATVVPYAEDVEQMRRALVLGLNDYVAKNGFDAVVVSVSGGIDSAVTAVLAVDALGPERVHCVSMPSRYSSEGTRADARQLAENLGCDFRELPIESVVEAYTGVLEDSFAGREVDVAEENLQARIRGTLAMALSNKFGWLLVASGNKSELSVGYATLYGDMAGGFALLKDVFKTDVFRLARHLNEFAGRELVPQSTIERAPSAELREGQLDEDSLPPYSELDRVLEAYVEEDRSLDELSADGFDPDVVARAVALIDRAEYKRRQAPPGVRLRPKAFGRDRRTPVTNRWRG
jgi:NAD+ synthase (glutamine-hydrolysing)